MSRKVGFLLALVVLMVPLIAGCGGDTGTIKIGLQGPMTGDYAYEGQGFEKAVGMLVEQVNAAGGIDGREVELLVEDDAGDPTQAALVAQRLVDAKVVAVIGAYNSTATEPASEIYNDAGILHITPSSTATGLTEKGFERLFRVCFLDDRQVLVDAKFAKAIYRVQTFGVFQHNSNSALPIIPL